MVNEEIKAILDNVYDMCEYMESRVGVGDLIETEGLIETCKEEMISFLSRLGMADGVVVLEEIEFLNDLFGTSYNLLDIKKMGRNYDDTGDYVMPLVLETACQFDQEEEDVSFAQAIVNAFYYLGIEFIACDEDVALEEIKILTEIISNYQRYLIDSEIDGEVFDIVEDLRARKYIQRKNDQDLYKVTEKKVEEVEIYSRDNELNEIMHEIEAKKYKKVRLSLLTLVNHIRIRNLRYERGLKNQEFSPNVALFGGKTEEVNDVAELLARLYCIEGVTKENFVTKFHCSGDDSGNRIESSLELAKQGNALVFGASQLTQAEIDSVLLAVKKNEFQSLMLAGDTNRLIAFFEKNRNVNSKFTRPFFMDGMDSEILGDIFEYLCVENDYKINDTAIQRLKQYFSNKEDQIEPFSLFQLFDLIVERQNDRILKEENLDSEKMITIVVEDVERALV